MMRVPRYEKAAPDAGKAAPVHLTMPRETIFGAGCLRAVGEAAARLGSRAFLVTAPESGRTKEVVDRVYGELVSHGMNPIASPMPEICPDMTVVDSAAKTCAENRCDVVVAVGGIGVIDAAKLLSLLGGSSSGSIRDLVTGEPHVEGHALPLVSVLTPPVTGAELVAAAFVADREDGVGRNLRHPHLLPEIVIVDPELALSVPPSTTALAGIGAFAHALEAFVSLQANELTDSLAAEAVRLVGQNLLGAVTDETDVDARMALTLAGYLAGAAANGTGPGIASLLAHPLGMTLGTPYVEALAVLLPATVEFNFDHAREKYERVPALLAGGTERTPREFPDVLARLYHEVGVDDIIARHSIDYGKIEETLSAVEDSHAGAEANPRPVDRAGVVRILRHAREHIHQLRLSRGQSVTA
jgi:1,3-propanediol dehydrogenase